MDTPTCDEVLKYMADKKFVNLDVLQKAFNSLVAIPLEELAASNFIGAGDNSRSDFYIEPKGVDLLTKYDSYSSFKSANLIPYEGNDFIKELEIMLHEKAYDYIDANILVTKYTVCKTMLQMDDIRSKIFTLLNELKESGYIEAQQDLFQSLKGKHRTGRFYKDDPILIRSKRKFEDEYNAKNTPPVVPSTTTIIVSGKGHVVAGRDISMGDYKKKKKVKKVGS